MKKALSLFLGLGIALAFASGHVYAATGYTLFDKAQIVSGGYSAPNAVETTSNTALSPAWGGDRLQCS